MLQFVLPEPCHREDILSFYEEFDRSGETCIGFGGWRDYDRWCAGMQDRHRGEHLPEGYVRENFYLCYEDSRLVGVCSIKFRLTEYLLHYGGHIGYAVRPSCRCRGLATAILAQCLRLCRAWHFDRVLCVCDADNTASERVIVKNGGVLENEMCDPEEQVTVRRYWLT